MASARTALAIKEVSGSEVAMKGLRAAVSLVCERVAHSRRAPLVFSAFFDSYHQPMQGLHLTADLRGCNSALAVMVDVAALRQLCLQAVVQAGLTAVAELFHRFPAPGGITGVVLLAESHLAVHTWPEMAAVTVDVYVCNLNGDNSAKAEQLMATLQAAFAATSAQHQRLLRGSAS
jgi:S-adenosylmethionine decarboxylase